MNISELLGIVKKSDLLEDSFIYDNKISCYICSIAFSYCMLSLYNYYLLFINK